MGTEQNLLHGEACPPVLIDKDTEIHCAIGVEEGWDKLQFWRIEGVVYLESYLAFVEASLIPTFPGMPNSHSSMFVVPSVLVFGLA